jgi:hypothetical protein
MSIRAIAAAIALAGLAAATVAAARAGEPAPPPPTPVKEKGRTAWAPHRGVTFDPAKENALWCSTFQMAWDSLGKDLLKGPVDLGPPAPPEFVKGMNGSPFPLDALDPASCVVAAGFVKDGVLERIAKEGKAKFDRKLPEMPVEATRPEDFVAYAFLLKVLPFETPFEPVRGGVRFPGASKPVGAWGVMHEGGPEVAAKRLAQVRLLYRAPEDREDAFVLEFTPKGGGDRILLVRQPGTDTLEKAWKAASDSIAAGKARALKEDAMIKVPRLHFDLVHSFGELRGAPFLNKGFEGYVVAQAAQSILFRLDEEGAVLKSEAVIAGKLSEPMERPDVFVFDRPFLVALIQKDAKEPYFLAWIANPDLMPK